MGTDINLAVEIREGGKWNLVTDEVFPNPNFNPNYAKGGWNSEFYRFLAIGRHHRLFARLAGVGLVEDPKPLFGARGLPGDVSDMWERESEGLFGISYASLAELDEALSDGRFTDFERIWAHISLSQYMQLRAGTGTPTNWTKDVDDEAPGLVISQGQAEALTMNDLVDLGQNPNYPLVLVEAVWDQDVSADTFRPLIDAMETVREQFPDVDPGDIRLVFGFSN